MADVTVTNRGSAGRLPPEIEAAIAKAPPGAQADLRAKALAQYQSQVAPQDTTKQLLDLVTKTGAENKSDINNLIGKGSTVLGWAGNDATGRENDALAGLTGAVNGLNYGGLPGYVGDVKSQGATATADPRSINAQFDALSQLKGLTNPAVTDKERFLEEQSRQSQERDQKSYMDSVLQNLNSRGIESGGAQIGAALGSQQETGNRRMLQDLGTNAGAVDRSLQALTGYGNLASGIRGQSFGEAQARGTAADDVAKFNSGLKQQTRINDAIRISTRTTRRRCRTRTT